MINILVITKIDDVEGLLNNLSKLGKVKYLPNATENDLITHINNYNVIFTNPNNSKVYLGKRILSKANNLKIICTASTGTVHIDNKYVKSKKIKLISLKKEINILRRISSTAELSFLLMLSHLRNIIPSVLSVKNKKWDYTSFVGNQMNAKKIGVLGYGRLGKKFAHYCHSFGSEVYIFDPFIKNVSKKYYKINDIKDFIKKIDVLSIHIHAEDNENFINSKIFKLMKKNIIIINTSRGEVINEKDLVIFLKKNKKAKYATDVLKDETNFKKNILLKINNDDNFLNQIIVTPHIGGMTLEGKKIAYNHAYKLLKQYIKKNDK